MVILAVEDVMMTIRPHCAHCKNRPAAVCHVCAGERTPLEKAAPDLLEQLKESTEILSDLLAGRNVTGRILDCLDSNRAAITKAREGQP